MVRCYVLAGQEPADEYRICTTWREPVDPELTQVLEPCAASGTFDGYPTKRYQLKPDALWPPGGSLVWKLRQPSVAMRREDLIGFSERLVDVAARLIFRASHARARQETLAPTSLASELELRTDYGRVAQQFPVVEEHEVLRE